MPVRACVCLRVRACALTGDARREPTTRRRYAPAKTRRQERERLARVCRVRAYKFLPVFTAPRIQLCIGEQTRRRAPPARSPGSSKCRSPKSGRMKVTEPRSRPRGAGKVALLVMTGCRVVVELIPFLASHLCFRLPKVCVPQSEDK